jgi:ferric-dicitrate binding protein FerR (iron transport regulator)
MNEETRSQLNAWFDGELSPAEQQRVQSLVDSDPEAKAYVEELRHTREALKAAHAHPSHAIPEWSQVEARLERPRPAQVLSLSRMLLTAAAVMVLGMAVWWPLRQAGIRQSIGSEELHVERVELVETDLEGATPIVYLDQPSGWTVVWVVEAVEEES